MCVCVVSGRTPTMPELFIFTGKSGKQFRLLDSIAPHWEEFAISLHFESYIVEATKRSCMFQVCLYTIYSSVYTRDY